MNVFLEHLNSLRPSKEFTMEMEEGSSLPFLDTLIKRNKDGTVDTSAYRKPTQTDHYLQYSSHHPSHVKLGIEPVENKKKEEEHLIQVLQENGFPYEVVRTALH